MVPAKVVRNWETLLIAGQPLYPQKEEEEEGERSSSSRASRSTCSVPPSDLIRESLLDETDFWQYRVRRPLHTLYELFLSNCITVERGGGLGAGGRREDSSGSARVPLSHPHPRGLQSPRRGGPTPAPSLSSPLPQVLPQSQSSGETILWEDHCTESAQST